VVFEGIHKGELKLLSVVAVGCHPDDIESGCFGTLTLYRKNGANVKVLLLTGGERGGDKVIRLAAAQNACKLIGASFAFAGFEDGKLSDNAETVSWIEKELENAASDIAFVPCPLDKHQDHRNGGNAAISAARKTGNVLLYETPTTIKFEPQIYVDIGQTIEMKIKAMALHKPSEEQARVLEVIRCLAKFRAYQMRQLGSEVEVFRVVKWKLDPGLT
jgi:LmbE family N-acetylglucosaminyl deacetylase